jgi:AcrR family transcriptional regulator
LGVKERQEREREAVGRSILDAARDLFVAEGYHNVSIRKIAERIEYSPGAIYSYFPSKDDIFFALAEEGFRLLFKPESRILVDEGNPVEVIREALYRVYEFSKTNPEHFALMFLDRKVPQISKNWDRFEFVREGKQKLGLILKRAIDEGHFPADTNPHAVFRILMSAVVGAAVARLCGRMEPGEDSDGLARDTLEAALTGLRAGFPKTFHPIVNGTNCPGSSLEE